MKLKGLFSDRNISAVMSDVNSDMEQSSHEFDTFWNFSECESPVGAMTFTFKDTGVDMKKLFYSKCLSIKMKFSASSSA